MTSDNPESNAQWSLEHVFKKAMYRAQCPSADELMLFRWGELDKKHYDEVLKHTSTCNACYQELALFLAPNKAQAPVASDLFDNVSKLWHVIVATLVPNTGLVYASVRSSQNQDKALIYELENLGWEISLNKQKKTLGYELSGQILSDILPDHLNIYLVKEGTIIQSTLRDANDCFLFQPVESGNYTIWFEFDDTQVQIQSIAL